MTDLALAQDLADIADRISMSRYRQWDLVVTTKPDMSPVSDADQAVERALREHLQTHRPDDTLVGEEYGGAMGAGRAWIIDPIDGTKNYVRGVPVWATLIALVDGDEVVVGMVAAPALQRRWWAAKGAGAYAGRSLSSAKRLQVSAVSTLADASLSYASLGGWADLDRRDDFIELMDSCWRTRAYGDFWSYMLLAEGAVDIAAEPELQVYDMAALDVIVREAGGRFTSLEGTDGPFGGNVLATNGHLHEAALSFLGSLPDDGDDPDVPRTGPGSVSELRDHRRD